MEYKEIKQLMEDMENLLDVQVILDVNILKDSKYYIMK